MAVLKNLRNLSNMQFYKTAIYIRQELTDWMLRDFGTTKNKKSVKQVIKDISPEDQQVIDEIFMKYGKSPNKVYQGEYPQWFMDHEREVILKILQELVENITRANTLYVSKGNRTEYELRRAYQDKAFLQDLLKNLIRLSDEMGLTVNTKKTQICRIDKGFRFLKLYHFVTDTGKVVRKPCKKNIVRERRKLRKMYKNGVLLDDVLESYKSWRGNMLKYNSYRTIRSMDQLFNEIYGEELYAERKSIVTKGSKDHHS